MGVQEELNSLWRESEAVADEAARANRDREARVARTRRLLEFLASGMNPGAGRYAVTGRPGEDEVLWGWRVDAKQVLLTSGHLAEFIHPGRATLRIEVEVGSPNLQGTPVPGALNDAEVAAVLFAAGITEVPPIL